MSFYVLKDVDWAWDDEGEGRSIVVMADSPEQAVKIATEKHIAEFPGAGGVTWDVGRINLVAFGDATWEDDNKPSYEPLTYYSDGINGPPDRDPARIMSAIEPAGVGVETAPPSGHVMGRWLPITQADKTINHVTEFTEIGLTLKNSDTFWVRDEDGRVYQAAWSEGNKGRDYWWDWEAESPVDPVEFMPHPLDPRFAALKGDEQ